MTEPTWPAAGLPFRAALAGSLLLWTATGSGLLGHESGQRTLRQNYGLRVDSRNINIELVSLFFFPRETLGDPGAAGLGGIPVEREELARSMGGNLKLLVDGQVVPLFRLHRPELERSGPEESAAPRTLTQTFFARTPNWLEAGSRITLQNLLPGQAYPESVFRIEEADGYRLRQEEGPGQVTGPTRGLLTLEASVLAAPATGTPPPQRAAGSTTWPSRLLLAWGLLTLFGVVVARRMKTQARAQA